MRSNNRKTALIFGVAAFAATIGMDIARAEDPGATAAYKDIEATLGFVPGFFKAFPESGIAGAWSEFVLNNNEDVPNGTQAAPDESDWMPPEEE